MFSSRTGPSSPLPSQPSARPPLVSPPLRASALLQVANETSPAPSPPTPCFLSPLPPPMSTARRGPTSRTSRIVSASSSLNQHATASGRMDPPPPPGSSRIARPASALSLNSSQSGRGGVDEELSSVAPAERGPRKAKAAVGGTASSSKSGASKKEDGEGGDVNIEVVLRCR